MFARRHSLARAWVLGRTRHGGAIALTIVVAVAAWLTLGGCEHAGADSSPSFAEVRPIVEKHCTSCHSSSPTSPVFPIAPNGVVFDTPEDLEKHSAKILQRTIVDRTMPLLNKTEMTDAERELLARWLRAQ
ncbi:hypothetical protein L6R52_24105 [Myxococcota bacterium]|nr:hypothetical protein [Myxococcota bacterium]